MNRWRLPLPVWAQRPYDDSGVRAWETLQRDLAGADPARPFCIYLHVPFCSSKCGFCDSYSFKLDSHRDERIAGYVDCLCRELRLWSEQGHLRQRPVSTVHLGGGTPPFLGEGGLARVVECCRDCFNVSPETEWALEATVESLVERWQARGLVEADPRGGLRLTASGAWFAGNLIAELTGQGPQQVCQA